MYAIVNTGGKQYKVDTDDVITVEKIEGKEGDKITLPVIFLNDGKKLVTDPDKLAKAKQKSAISPNYVHSLDAAALMRTVCCCADEGILSFAMIHDSYGTHAADSERLAAILRTTFVGMFGGGANMLELWSREVMAPVPAAVLQKLDGLPAIPAFGELDVEAVKRSLFFFA